MERITFEGIDGVGKTTTITHLENRLTAMGFRVLVQAEPGTTELGQYLRGEMKSKPTSDFERVLMMYLSRYSMLDADESGYDYIISDRCWLSTLAYQCSANPKLLELVQRIQADYQRKFVGGTLFIIDGTPELAATRRGLRGDTDHLENFDRKQAEAMYQIYRSAYTPKAVNYVIGHPQLFDESIADVCMFAHYEAKACFNHIEAINAQWMPEHQVEVILRYIDQHRILDRGAQSWELAVS